MTGTVGDLAGRGVPFISLHAVNCFFAFCALAVCAISWGAPPGTRIRCRAM